MSDSNMTYMVIGGHPHTSYTGTRTFTGLRIYAKNVSKDDLKAVVDRAYGECAGLVLVVDKDGNEVEC
jgi:hypothetical protein